LAKKIIDGHLAVYLLHALMNDRVTSCLTDDQIGPLYENNWHEECWVTRVFQHLALCVRLHRQTVKTSPSGAAYKGRGLGRCPEAIRNSTRLSLSWNTSGVRFTNIVVRHVVRYVIKLS